MAYLKVVQMADTMVVYLVAKMDEMKVLEKAVPSVVE